MPQTGIEPFQECGNAHRKEVCGISALIVQLLYNFFPTGFSYVLRRSSTTLYQNNLSKIPENFFQFLPQHINIFARRKCDNLIISMWKEYFGNIINNLRFSGLAFYNFSKSLIFPLLTIPSAMLSLPFINPS